MSEVRQLRDVIETMTVITEPEGDHFVTIVRMSLTGLQPRKTSASWGEARALHAKAVSVCKISVDTLNRLHQAPLN